MDVDFNNMGKYEFLRVRNYGFSLLNAENRARGVLRTNGRRVVGGKWNAFRRDFLFQPCNFISYLLPMGTVNKLENASILYKSS